MMMPYKIQQNSPLSARCTVNDRSGGGTGKTLRLDKKKLKYKGY